MFMTNPLTGSLAGSLIDAAVGVLTAAAIGAGALLPTTPSPPLSVPPPLSSPHERAGSVPAEQIHAQLEQLVDDHDLTAGLVRVGNDRSAWSEAVGVRDLESGHPAAAGGYFRIGSVTKTFVATVVLQLVS
jgi:CubicO group peptidase (beta-lactamase class C family)